MQLPKARNQNVATTGNVAMGGFAGVLLVMVVGWLGGDVPGEGAAALGAFLGGLFQKFNLFG